MNAPGKTTLPPNRIPIAKLLARESATPEAIAKAVGMTEQEVMVPLFWHFDRGNAERVGAAWRLTPAGVAWLRERTDEPAPRRAATVTPRPVAPVTAVKAPRPPVERAPQRKCRTEPDMAEAEAARFRFVDAGLWEFVERFARIRGVNWTFLLGGVWTRHLQAARRDLYAELRDYPGREYSSGEIAWFFGYYDGSTVRHVLNRMARKIVRKAA